MHFFRKRKLILTRNTKKNRNQLKLNIQFLLYCSHWETREYPV
ncbi:hypothetical protein EHQ24_06660 [Leptospira noumeaensis]|uniref:Uncharacterized protein n=1 Tax=Leptospira noumeaensis TaxID=2484964 RepID=A0A4R9IDU1_9LEPT|nr:hypothetical protein EHQ24_06660 [Leptospira noumeaensis]